jgi:hypothetical protein
MRILRPARALDLIDAIFLAQLRARGAAREDLPLAQLRREPSQQNCTVLVTVSLCGLGLNLRDGLVPGALSLTAAHHLSPRLACTADERCNQETDCHYGGTHASRDPDHKGTSLLQLRAPRHRRMRRTLESAMRGRQADATRF